MDLTESYRAVIPADVLSRYEWRETRNAASVLAATGPQELEGLVQVLREFSLAEADIVVPGGRLSTVAQRLDTAFRTLGWREGRYDTRIRSELRIMPYAPAGERKPIVIQTDIGSEGYKIDQIKGRVVLDIEWHAKDGNLDRDVGAYRALYDAGIVDVAVIVTRDFESIRALSVRLGRPGGFSTTTTTTLGKLEPRMTRGDAGGCPLLAVAITDRCLRS